FQGGNILVGDDFVLIGIDYPTKTLDYIDTAVSRQTGESKENAVRRLFGLYLDQARTISYVGSNLPVPEWELRLTVIDGQIWIEELFGGNIRGTRQPIFHIDM